MGEVALARLWHFPDGTTCLLLKDPQADNWVVRVARAGRELRSEHFSSALVAMEQGKHWRASFDPTFLASQ